MGQFKLDIGWKGKDAALGMLDYLGNLLIFFKKHDVKRCLVLTFLIECDIMK